MWFFSDWFHYIDFLNISQIEMYGIVVNYFWRLLNWHNFNHKIFWTIIFYLYKVYLENEFFSYFCTNVFMVGSSLFNSYFKQRLKWFWFDNVTVELCIHSRIKISFKLYYYVRFHYILYSIKIKTIPGMMSGITQQ